MGFFDKVTKAVGDAVDKGKKDIDQFMRIQKINGEISAIEAKVAEFETQIQQNSQAAGRTAIELLRAGSFANPELQVFADTFVAIEQQIAAQQVAIATKRADIEKIKAEDEAEHVAAAPAPAPGAPAAAPVTVAPAAPPVPTPAAAAPMAPPPLPAQPSTDDVPTGPIVPPVPMAARACPHCGKPLTGGAFCTECGAKVG
jgi:hypothetical protein